jgi:hypothetical protein
MHNQSTASSPTTKQDYWQEHIASWKTSGLTQKEYCRANSLSVQSFGYWKRKDDTRPHGQTRFFPLAVSPPLLESKTSSSSRLDIKLRGDRFRIEIKDDFSPMLLQKLIVALEQL